MLRWSAEGAAGLLQQAGPGVDQVVALVVAQHQRSVQEHLPVEEAWPHISQLAWGLSWIDDPHHCVVVLTLAWYMWRPNVYSRADLVCTHAPQTCNALSPQRACTCD
jgi:hypothetical protein